MAAEPIAAPAAEERLTRAVAAIPERPTSPIQHFCKRAVDVIGAALTLVLTLPVLCLAVLAIKLESPGPVFFSHIRLGRNGRPFRFYKLRSMCEEAVELRAAVEGLNEVSGPVFKIRNDPRLTRVGSILRKTSIDELPQLWHVLTGQMSLVGPRPAVPDEVVHYDPWMLERLSVQPGLTCIWQVSGRSDIGFEEWMELDVEYVRNRSLWLDLKILILTVPAVLTCRGAY